MPLQRDVQTVTLAGDPLVFVYLFTIRPGMAKGWGIHREHEDRYAFLSGELELAFFDAREDSATAGEESRLVLSDARPLFEGPFGCPPELEFAAISDPVTQLGTTTVINIHLVQ